MAGKPLTALLGSVAWAGHAFPIFALAAELRRRGHRVLVETPERWRGTVEALDLELVPAAERMRFGGLGSGEPGEVSLADAARSSAARMRAAGADVVVADLFTLAPALGAELAGVRHATLIPHPYPVTEPGLPFFFLGRRPPRTPLGRMLWRAAAPLQTMVQPRLRRTRAALNAVREELGLVTTDSLHGPVSKGLTLVATFPQLEYARRWPAPVQITGPMSFDLPRTPVEPPPGGDPLVVVAASTEHDRDRALIGTALEALAGEPVRVIASMNRDGAHWPGEVPANARVAEWLSYAEAMPGAALVLTSGGHGTVARALAAGAPVLVCPESGDMAENAARVAWAGAGVRLSRRRLRPGPLRAAVRRVLADRALGERARELAAWNREHPGAASGADLVEGYAGR